MEHELGVRSDADIYTEHRRELMRFATTLVGPSDAADVVSEATESLLRSDSLSEAENPRALLHRAVHNKARSYQRSVIRRRRREQTFGQELVVELPDLRPDVVAAVVGLSRQQKACVYLTYWHDLAPTEVGAWLGIGVGSVKRHLARARANLREVLDG